MTATDNFIEFADANYDNGAYNARRDVEQLELIAAKISATMAELKPMFDALNIARDVVSPRTAIRTIRRSQWDGSVIRQMIVDSLAGELLGDLAGKALGEMVEGRE